MDRLGNKKGHRGSLLIDRDVSIKVNERFNLNNNQNQCKRAEFGTAEGKGLTSKWPKKQNF